MKERPIRFSTPMVRALLDDKKTQTRRMIARQPVDGWTFDVPPQFGRVTSRHPKKGLFGAFIRHGVYMDFPSFDLVPCPYGMPGDRLWVREAWRTTGDDGRADDMPPRDLQAHPVWFEADGRAPVDLCVGKYRPSMFMPRWASHIALTVTSVRLERLQSINDTDAKFEGTAQKMPEWWSGAEGQAATSPSAAFALLGTV
ncbi:Phage-like protein [Candidatus Burkholderia humilis]|nr:Phage-like protein [Candidatus Burkholderia humilis]